MDGATRTQIRLLADDADDLARKAVFEGTRALFAEHAARGVLQSGATIRVAVRLFEGEAGNLIAKLTDAVAALSKEPEAFALIADCLARFDAFLQVTGIACEDIAFAQFILDLFHLFAHCVKLQANLSDSLRCNG